ncbi:hypothetical protein EAF04_007689 [Stromatinia cepivora]|nr:hypothetical protein EAF04_007689 [Stromatinia cepivora]
MKFTQVALPLLFSAAAIAAPVADKTLKARSTKICGQWDTVPTGAYTVYQNLWGMAQASSGSQCTTVDSLSGNTIAWSTSWSWAGGSSSVKSYANVALQSVATAGVQVSSISSIPAVWKWGYTGSSIVADVSWDLFTAATASGTNQYEIMIWLAAIGGAGPISSTGSPVATATIAGHEFKLYSGPNGDTTVYSFVASTQITDFSGDLMDFLNYLATNEKWSKSQYIKVLQAGTEPFTGTNAVLSVSDYSVSISKGGSSKAQSTPATPNKAAVPTSAPATTEPATTSPTTSTTTSSTASESIPLYGNCTGGKSCSQGTCVAQNPWYSQCLSA